jgi:hypothetical protein
MVRRWSTVISYFRNSNAGQGSHHAFGCGFQVMGFHAVTFPEILFSHQVIIADYYDTVDAFHLADVPCSCFKLDRVKTKERRSASFCDVTATELLLQQKDRRTKTARQIRNEVRFRIRNEVRFRMKCERGKPLVIFNVSSNSVFLYLQAMIAVAISLC